LYAVGGQKPSKGWKSQVIFKFIDQVFLTAKLEMAQATRKRRLTQLCH
jgi:hypothetical protein